MKKPYIKNFCKIGNIKVFIVDGPWVRKNLCEDFVDFDHPLHAKFIPENEFWMEKEYDPGEENFALDHLITEYFLMKTGTKYNQAYKKALSVEIRERRKSKPIIKVREIKNKTERLKKVKIKQLKKYSNGIKVFIVRGKLVRDLFLLKEDEFMGGGHDKVYWFVPRGEIWLDDLMSERERRFILVHELHERSLMARGWKYHPAHKKATIVEHFCRHNPKKIDKILAIELKAQKKEK
jgi:hypothetical protein